MNSITVSFFLDLVISTSGLMWLLWTKLICLSLKHLIGADGEMFEVCHIIWPKGPKKISLPRVGLVFAIYRSSSSKDVGSDVQRRHIVLMLPWKGQKSFMPAHIWSEIIQAFASFLFYLNYSLSICCAEKAFTRSKFILFPLFVHNPSLWKVGICFSPEE